MTAVPGYQVDAFATDRFRGNAAAVEVDLRLHGQRVAVGGACQPVIAGWLHV